MMVDPDRAAGHVEHKGVTYYFCSKGCVAKFGAAPEKYLSGKREPMHAPMVQIGGLKKPTVAEPRVPSPEPRTPRYTCPMDPEVVSDRPGACPKCGMALEPMVEDLSTVEADAPNPELVDMTRRFWIGVVLGAPVFLLTMGDMVPAGL
jgi:Cu+-exporting ATPase